MNDIDGMGTSPVYDWLIVVLSVIGLILSIFYTFRVVKAYQFYHDERAAVALAKAIGLEVIAFGMLVSGTGLILDTSTLAVAGLSIARGAFIVLVATLVLADVRPHDDSSKKIQEAKHGG
jgi:hypothetical protein